MEATVLSMTSDSFCLFYTVLTPKSAPLSILSCPCFPWIIFLLISKRSWIDVFFSFPVIALFCATAFLSAFPASLTAVFASTPALDTRRPGHGLHGVWNSQGAVLLSADRPIQRRTPLGGKRSSEKTNKRGFYIAIRKICCIWLMIIVFALKFRITCMFLVPMPQVYNNFPLLATLTHRLKPVELR